MTKLDLTAANIDVNIVGDDAAIRTITIGQSNIFEDVVVIVGSNFSVTAAGVGNFAGVVTFDASPTAPVSGTNNTERFGSGAGGGLTDGGSNHMFGRNAGSNITSGNNNTCFGLNSGQGISTSSSSVAIGNSAILNSNGGNNVAVGHNAMRYSEGASNLAIGQTALEGSQVTAHTGSRNIAIGKDTLCLVQGAANDNVGVGDGSMPALTTGDQNIGIGTNTGLLATTGSDNILIGHNAGDTITTGSTNILIGSGIDTTAAGTNSELRIGVSGSDPIISADMTGKLAGVNNLPAANDATLHVKTDTADAVSCLKLEQDDIDQPMIDFEGTEGAAVANSLSSRTVATVNGFIQIDVNGVKRWIATYNDPTS